MAEPNHSLLRDFFLKIEDCPRCRGKHAEVLFVKTHNKTKEFTHTGLCARHCKNPSSGKKQLAPVLMITSPPPFEQVDPELAELFLWWIGLSNKKRKQLHRVHADLFVKVGEVYYMR